MDDNITNIHLTCEPLTNMFTCSTCHITFKDSDAHSVHYKSEWHRYNLYRKMSGLSPLTLETFAKRSTVYSTGSGNNKDNKEKEKKIQKCILCQKKFGSVKQYNNHLVSKNHKKMEEQNKDNVNKNLKNVENKMDTDSDIESLDSEEWLDDLENPIERNDCLFCDHHSRSLTLNLKHMMVKHSFFVPDLEYCIDKRGLLTYLGEKIYSEYKCIWCNDSGRQLQSVEAVRSHMIDKGHCMMLFEGETLLEYMQFYDYSLSYPDAEDADPDSEPPKMELSVEGYELKLPSGKVIGHRALMRYYKQNLSLEPVTKTRTNEEKIRKLMMQYRALGDANMQVEASRRRARDVQYLQRVQTKYSTQLQFKQNKLQKHFKRQTNFF
ncbi:zinc finger protein 622 [Nylanderia fulva]|uniref:zinc finger protein 622 n=1 Tax=Nylanderia fulva TaxID=613905 RepID=UPI0010FAD1B6|nr:zinc finger protein 622 [Nylanderia fulva]